MSSGGFGTTHYQNTQMTIESTDLQNSTNPAITYSECYAQPFFNLLFGESLELLKTMPNKSIDLILTDPPYNINVQRVNCAAHRKDNRSRTKVDWDNNFELQPFLDEFFRIGKNVIVWGANYHNAFFDKGGAIIWDKLQPLPDSSQCEIASLTKYKKVFKYTQRWTNFVNTKETQHPTEKPVALMEFCINIFDAKSILDPFMGSGTTGVACKNLNRNFIGIEKDENYFNIAKNRIESHTVQSELF